MASSPSLAAACPIRERAYSNGSHAFLHLSFLKGGSQSDGPYRDAMDAGWPSMKAPTFWK